MVGESNQNVFLIQIDALSFAECEISESEISRFDCMSSDEIQNIFLHIKGNNSQVTQLCGQVTSLCTQINTFFQYTILEKAAMAKVYC